MELTSKINAESTTQNEALEDYYFIANCLKIGLKIEDLKQLKYTDVAKLMLCFCENTDKEAKRNATTRDWDLLAGGK